MIKLIFTFLMILLGAYHAFSSAAAPPKVNAAVTRQQQQRVSKSIYAKLKAQALSEARAELAREVEARERAKLEALQELDAGASDTGEPRSQDATTNLVNE